MQDVLQQRSLEQLIRLPERDAVHLHFAGGNARLLFRLQLVFALAALAAAVVALLRPEYQRLVAPVIALAGVRLLFALRDRPFFDRHVRTILLIALVVQPLLTVALYYQASRPIRPYDFMLLAVLLLFRLPVADLLIPVGSLWSATAGRHLLAAATRQTELDVPGVIGLSAAAVTVLVVGGTVLHRQRASFLGTWRQAQRREAERAHLQREIHQAHRIQLSMLPPRDPQIPWLDIAGISVPASEVGGDYYGYYEVDENRQAIVVADVAGHGLASGLLLSGVRSCLHLMHEEPPPPAEVLGKLDRMIRATTDRRTFVTLVYALVDRHAREVTFSAAGHPPMYHRCAATGEVTIHGISAPPLGTRLPALGERQQRTVPLEAGDLIVLITDGLAEAANRGGELYDDHRLVKRLTSVGTDRSALEIRDMLINDLWRFKGDAEQGDDVTIVVARAPRDG